MVLAGYVVLSWKTLQDDVLVLAIRDTLLEFDGTEAVAALVLLVEKVIGVFIQPHLYHFHFSVCRSQGLARATVELLTQSWPYALFVPYSLLLRFPLEPPHDTESRAGCREVKDAVQIVIFIIRSLAGDRLIVVQF